MKKILFIASFLLCAAFTSCEKDEIGGTATEALAGQWYVVYDGVSASGEVTMEDPFGVGRSLLLTYNTSANDGKEIFVDDLSNFWDFKVKTPCNVGALSFGSATAAEDLKNGIDVELTDGKILKGAAATPSGAAADSICFYVVFSDDKYVGKYWDKIRVSGYRYTGLAADEE